LLLVPKFWWSDFEKKIKPEHNHNSQSKYTSLLPPQLSPISPGLSIEGFAGPFSLGKYNCQKVLPETLICYATRRNTAESFSPAQKGKSPLVNRNSNERVVELSCVEFTSIYVRCFPQIKFMPSHLACGKWELL